MNIFIEQGRCRICSKMFCCLEHQKAHENLEHSEYADWLNVLPVMCRRCHRNITNIKDLNTQCVRLMKHQFIEGTYTGTPRPSRKRRIALKENLEPLSTDEKTESRCPLLTDSVTESRRKIVSAGKPLRKSLSPGFHFINVNADGQLRTVFSPHSNNVSYKTLVTNVTKSSTPLNDDKENIDSSNENHTPENISTNSIVLVSALKKISTPLEKNLERKVTFKDEYFSKVKSSVYSTPVASIEAQDGRYCDVVSFINVSPSVNQDDDCVDGVVKSDEQKYDCEIISVVRFSPAVNHESELDTITVEENPVECKILTVARSLQLTLSGIPRSLLSIWDWTQQKFRKKNKRTVIDSPPSKRLKLVGNTMLRRRPIFSHWINTSSSSLVRNPLPTYVRKYSDESF